MVWILIVIAVLAFVLGFVNWFRFDRDMSRSEVLGPILLSAAISILSIVLYAF